MSRAVIDQPGLKTLIAGVLLAILLGFVFKYQIRQEKIDLALAKAIENLRRDFRLDYSKAEIKLSKWGWPYPHLLISDIRMSSLLIKCQNSQIYIDQLEIPLNFQMILATTHKIEKIRAKQVELRLADFKECSGLTADKDAKQPVYYDQNTNEVSYVESNLNTQNTQIHDQTVNAEKIILENKKLKNTKTDSNRLSNLRQIFNKPTKAVLENVIIENLKIINTVWPDQPLQFRQFNLHLNYENNKLSEISVKTKFYSIRDIKNDSYYLVSDLNLALGHSTQQNIVLSLKGRLLEGMVSLLVHSKIDQEILNYDLNAQRISIKSLVPILNHFSNSYNLDKWPVNFNFQINGEIKNNNNVLIHKSEIRDFVGVGQNADFIVPLFVLNHDGVKLDVAPFNLVINELTLTPLKNILPKQFDLSSVDSLGVFKGELNYKDHNSWLLKGELTDPQIIFSNQGRREFLNIDSINLNVQNKNTVTDFILTDLKVADQSTEGQLNGEYFKTDKSINLKAQFKGLNLTNKIWNQFTKVDQNPKVNINWNYKKNTEIRNQINLEIDQIKFSGFEIKESKIDFINIKNDSIQSLLVNLKSIEGNLNTRQISFSPFNKIIEADPMLFSDEIIKYNKFQISLIGDSWKNMKYEFDSNWFIESPRKIGVTMKSKGEWLQNGRIEGDFSVYSSSNELNKRFNIRAVGGIDGKENSEIQVNQILDQ